MGHSLIAIARMVHGQDGKQRDNAQYLPINL